MTPQPDPLMSSPVPPVPPPIPEPSAEPESAPAEPRMSELSRLIGVFFSPEQAFADIAKRPRWWVPILIMAVFSSLLSVTITRRISMEDLIRRSIERSPQAANMTPQQMANTVRVAAQVAKVSMYGGAVVSTTLVLAFVALIFKFLFDTILGADIGYVRMLAITAYGWLPNLVSGILTVVVLFLKDPEDFDPQNALAFNVGAFLPQSAPRWLTGLGSSLDLFSFWIMVLIAIGVSQAARRMSFAKALGGVIFPWVLFVLLKTAFLAVRG